MPRASRHCLCPSAWFVRVPPFSLSCYGDHRDLHSFPTRRSSDLTGGRRDRFRPAASCCRKSCAPTCRSARKPRRSSIRSEEHTSELQSLRHLVCRLLLEKKKKDHGSQGESHTGDDAGARATVTL